MTGTLKITSFKLGAYIWNDGMDYIESLENSGHFHGVILNRMENRTGRERRIFVTCNWEVYCSARLGLGLSHMLADKH